MLVSSPRPPRAFARFLDAQHEPIDAGWRCSFSRAAFLHGEHVLELATATAAV